MNNRDELINKVTSEVMKLYGVESSDTSQCVKCTTEVSDGSRKPTPISNQSADQEINASASISKQLRVPANSASQKAIMMVCGNNNLQQESLEHFRNLKSRYRKIQVLLSANAEKMYGEIKGRPYFGYEYPVDAINDLQNWDHFYLINPTLNTLSKIAAMQADNRVALASRKALLWGKSVTIFLDQFPQLPIGMQSEFNKVISTLTEFGYDLQVPSENASNSLKPNFPDTKPTQIFNKQRSTEVLSVKTGRKDNFVAPVISSNDQLAQYIDHTLLKPEATQADIEKHCEEARQYSFFSVCVNPAYVELSAQLLSDCNVKVCTVYN